MIAHGMEESRGPIRIAIGSDRAGYGYKEALAADLRANDLVASVIDVGVDDRKSVAYPEIAFAAGKLVGTGKADRALLICHTGLGMAIAANKVPGIRAVTAHDSLSVRRSVVSNNAQVVAFGQGIVDLALARRLTAEWLTYRFENSSGATTKIETILAFERTTRLET